MGVNILIGDALAELRKMPDASVHCCVTSPPYFGLRDYGVAGQMGLEATPDAFVAGMVAVFAEVRRVLRDDGVLFLNIGDSYYSTNGKTTGGCSPKSTLAGGGGRYREGSKAEAMFSQTARAQRGAACGNLDTAPEGSLARGCFCQSLCGACREAYRIGKSHSVHSPVPTPSVSSSASSPAHTELQTGHLPTSGSVRRRGRNATAIPDPAPVVVREGARLPAAPGSTTLQSLPPLQATCSADEIQDGGCQLCGRSLQRSAQGSAHMAECICGSAPLGLTDRNRGTDASGLAYPSLTTESLKPKDLIGIPWLLAFALRADGWYLRQDLIWSKPNPMPESVRDRCTKAHEYLFLLSKGPRYYYDAEAIKEDAIHEGRVVKASGPDAQNAQKGKFGATAAGFTSHDTLVTNRNKRSVWTVATQPFSEAHFATFPPDLIQPCILAGCPVGGTVLDPFGGAGTTGLVADRLQRNAILIELNPEYAAMARRRIDSDRGGLLDAMEAA